MKLKPLGDRLIVRAVEEEATTASGLVVFSQDWRERIKTENPDAGFGMLFVHSWLVASLIVFAPGEVGKLLGAKWKELDDEIDQLDPDEWGDDAAKAVDIEVAAQQL